MRSNKRAAAGSQYALIVGLIAVIAILAITSVGANLNRLLKNVSNTVGAAEATPVAAVVNLPPLTDVNGLTGGPAGTTWNFSIPTFDTHDFNLILPANYQNRTIAVGKLYYRLLDTTPMSVTATLSATRGGTALLTATASNVSATPRGTTETDRYLAPDFGNQALTIPANGIIWVRLVNNSGGGNKSTIQGPSTYSDTYYQATTLRSATYPSFFLEVQ